MMRVRHLMQLLRDLPPDALVTTWDGGTKEDVAVETAILVDGVYERVLVLGMELPAALLRQGEVVWTSAPGVSLGLPSANEESREAS